MSQLAIFHLINVSLLPELSARSEPTVVKKWFSKKIIDNYMPYLNDNATLLYGFNPDHLNGAIFVTILIYLDERHHIKLEESIYNEVSTEITEKQQTSTLILTHTHKEQFNAAINIDALTREECRSATIEYDGDDSDETVDAFIEGMQVLRNVLNQIRDENSVVIFSIC